MNNIDDLINILETNFQFFVDEFLLDFTKKTNKFALISDTSNLYQDLNNNNNNNNNNIIICHKKYSIKFPHDMAQDNPDIKLFLEKYKRRIARLYDLMANDSVKKIFIILNKNINKKINKNKKLLLESLLKKNCSNYELRIISNYNNNSDWKKDDLDWDKILS
jgi:hypothetical protein